MVQDFITILIESLFLDIPKELKDKIIKQLQENNFSISDNFVFY